MLNKATWRRINEIFFFYYAITPAEHYIRLCRPTDLLGSEGRAEEAKRLANAVEQPIQSQQSQSVLNESEPSSAAKTASPSSASGVSSVPLILLVSFYVMSSAASYYL